MSQIKKWESAGSFRYVNTGVSNIKPHQPVSFGGLEGITNHFEVAPGEVGVADLWANGAVTGWEVDFEAPIGSAINLGSTVTAGGFTGYAIHGPKTEPTDNVVAKVGDEVVYVLAVSTNAATLSDEAFRSIHRDGAPSSEPSALEWPSPQLNNQATIYYTNGSTISTLVELWEYNGSIWNLLSTQDTAIEPPPATVTITGHGINSGLAAAEGELWPLYGAYWDKENGTVATISTTSNQDTDPMNAVVVGVVGANQVLVRLTSELESLGQRDITASGANLMEGRTYWLQADGSVGTTQTTVRVAQAYDATTYYGAFHSYKEAESIIVPGPEDYLHTQAVASTVWVVNHNFGVDIESVSVFIDDNGTLTPTQTAWINTNTNTVTITLATAQSGYVVVERPYTA